MNGLIYYDQFDRLSRTNVVFVTIGIAILLLGVWAVSMPQEVDDGSTQDGELEDDQWTAGTTLTSDVEGGRLGHGVISLTSPPLSPRTSSAWQDPHRRAATTPSITTTDIEEYVSPLLTPPPRQPSRRTVSSPSDLLYSITDEETVLVSPVSPTDPSLIHSADALDSLRTPPLRVRTMSGSSQYRSPPAHHATFGGVHVPYASPPRRRGRRGTIGADGSLREGGGGSSRDGNADEGLLPHSPPPLPGFSIGLSPLSPGFALLPRERNRESQLGEDERRASVDDGGQGGESEGDVGRSTPSRRWLGLRGIVRYFRRPARSS